MTRRVKKMGSRRTRRAQRGGQSTGSVYYLAGSTKGGWGFLDGPYPYFTFFDKPNGMAIDLDGNIIVADKNNHRIRKLGF